MSRIRGCTAPCHCEPKKLNKFDESSAVLDTVPSAPVRHDGILCHVSSSWSCAWHLTGMAYVNGKKRGGCVPTPSFLPRMNAYMFPSKPFITTASHCRSPSAHRKTFDEFHVHVPENDETIKQRRSLGPVGSRKREPLFEDV